MTKFIGSTGLTYLWSKIKTWVQSAFVSNVSISGDKVRVTKNGSNTDLTVPYANNSGTATKLGSSTVGSSSIPIYLSSGTPTQVSAIDGSILSGYIGYNKTGFLVTHPEASNGIVVPYLYNDIAFLKSQGGSVSIYSTTSTNLTAETLTVKTDWNSLSGIDNMFNASPEYFNAGNGNASTMNADGLIIDITLPRVFSYTNVFYIDFGNSSWGFGNIDIFVKNSNNETSYVNKILGGAVNYKSEYYVKISHSSTNSGGTTVSGFNRIRLHLYGRTAGDGVRIAQIGLINFSSQGHRYTVMSRGIDDGVWRNISPAKNNTYSLGNSSYRWSNIYSTSGNFSGAITGNSFVKSGGTSSQFLKADGSVDSTSYAPQSGTYSKTEVNNALNTKQNVLTFDTVPTENSTNPVTSGGVYKFLSDSELVISSSLNDLNARALSLESRMTAAEDSIDTKPYVGSGDTNVIEIVKVNGTALTPDPDKAVDVTVPTESTVTGWGFTKNTGTYTKPSGGIPKTDLASSVQTSLGKADTALQSYESEFVYNLDASNLGSTGKKTISSAEPYNAINAAYLAGKHVQVKVGNFDASMGMVDVFLPLITLQLAPYTFMLNLKTPYGAFYIGAEVYRDRVVIEFIPL